MLIKHIYANVKLCTNSLILIIAGASADASADKSTDKFLKKLCFSHFFWIPSLPEAYLRLGVTFVLAFHNNAGTFLLAT